MSNLYALWGNAAQSPPPSAFTPPPPPSRLDSGTALLRLLMGANWGTGTHYGVPRSTARGGRNVGANGLDGTLPAELGKLTDLELLCAAQLSAMAVRLADRSAPRAYALRWCAVLALRTSSTARSAAG